MEAAGSTITAQVDLLWSVALAFLLANIYVMARTFDPELNPKIGQIDKCILYLVIFLSGVSMVSGYFVYGAIVTVSTCAQSSESIVVGTFCTLDGSAADSARLDAQLKAFRTAERAAFWQAISFAFGLVVFVFFFFRNISVVAAAFKK